MRALKAAAWKLFSEYVRRKDADEGGTNYCYTCRRPFFWKELHAGHAIPGRHNMVLFDEEIVKPQCVQDNIFRSGAYPEFVTRLIQENGLLWWERKLAASRGILKLTRSDVEAIIETYKDKLGRLEGSKDAQALEARG